MVKKVPYITEEYLNECVIKEVVEEVPNHVLSFIDKPIVSIVLITFQHIEFIEDSINGIIKQKSDYQWELIIGDDDSNDGTREVCKEYALKYPERIRLFLNKRANNLSILGKPCGIFQTVYSLLKARGKYIALCSGDDIWQDEFKIDKQVKYLEENRNCSLTYHDWIEIYKTEESFCYGKIRKDFPKASTMVFLNVNKELPVSFLNVIQEDLFLQFMLNKKGDVHYLESIKPVIVNTPDNSLTRTLDPGTRRSQVFNLYENVLYAYYGTPLKNTAIRYLLSSYKVILGQSNLASYFGNMYAVIRSISKVIGHLVFNKK
jgi:glycosyltransferase involved in cell wall biosynthesis